MSDMRKPLGSLLVELSSNGYEVCIRPIEKGSVCVVMIKDNHRINRVLMSDDFDIFGTPDGTLIYFINTIKTELDVVLKEGGK